MPTSLFNEMDHGDGGIEDQRALQLALELTMLGLSDPNSDSINPSFDSDGRNKKSQNMTECVPVPSSEHVAEIVGRQGCKIKALRAKTNTYIKTPVRGEEPVFVVTGRKEDVTLAKKEILSAADHFSQIRASRKSNMNGSLAPGPPNNIPGQTTIQVRVPYRVVGLVVGPKGATIKRIQQQTQTYIVTPSREKDPVFEVTGLPENVDTARKEIEAHIAMRTGGIVGPCDDQNDFHSNGIEQNFNNSLGGDLVSLYRSSLNGLNSLNSAFSAYDDNGSILGSQNQDSNNIFFSKLSDFGSSFTSNGVNIYDSVDEGISESPTFDPAVAPPTPSSLWPDYSSTRNSSTTPFSTSNGILNGLPRRSSSISGPSLTPRLSPTLTDPQIGLFDHPPARRISSDPLSVLSSLLPTSTDVNFMSGVTSASTLLNGFGTSVTSRFGSTAGSTSSSPTDSDGSNSHKGKRDCAICYESDVVAALVPCGHNLFCMECANRVCDKPKPQCPICHQRVAQAIRIYS